VEVAVITPHTLHTGVTCYWSPIKYPFSHEKTRLEITGNLSPLADTTRQQDKGIISGLTVGGCVVFIVFSPLFSLSALALSCIFIFAYSSGLLRYKASFYSTSYNYTVLIKININCAATLLILYTLFLSFEPV
jgi:hypothetical protein